MRNAEKLILGLGLGLGLGIPVLVFVACIVSRWVREHRRLLRISSEQTDTAALEQQPNVAVNMADLSRPQASPSGAAGHKRRGSLESVDPVQVHVRSPVAEGGGNFKFTEG
jgi:hypothetical protein